MRRIAGTNLSNIKVFDMAQVILLAKALLTEEGGPRKRWKEHPPTAKRRELSIALVNKNWTQKMKKWTRKGVFIPRTA